MTFPGADRACSHASPGDPEPSVDLRALALLALDRLDPLLARLRAAAADGAPSGPRPPGEPCPLCTALAVARGERPELAGRLAEHGAAVVAALRDALAVRPPGAPDGEPGTSEPDAPATPPQARPVQRITVDRPSRAGGAAPC